MVNWHSPTELARDTVAFSNLMHVLFGLYLWEFCVSFDFDLSFISGKRRFRWPMIFYFIGRYCLLGALIGTVIALNVHSKLNCQALVAFNQSTGNIAVGMASINLSLRTMVVWEKKWYIVCTLVAISLGHWSLLLHGVLVTAVWVPDVGCVLTSTNTKLLTVTIIYTMSFDLVILLLTAFKLVRPSMPKGRLAHMIFTDGLYFFIIAFLANLIATIFMILDLNAVMSVIGHAGAYIASTIAASRVVRRLANFFSADVDVLSATANGSSVLRHTFVKPRTGVHVQMDTIKFSEPATSICDAEGRVEKVGRVDERRSTVLVSCDSATPSDS